MGIGVGVPTNPHMWVFPKEQSDLGGNVELRIMRLDQFAIAQFRSKYGADKVLNPYIWGSYFPNDIIFLDQTNNSDIIVLPGEIDYSNIDQMVGIRLAKMAFDFNDKDGYSGTDAQGNVIPWTDLFGSGYTLSQLIFNDKTENTTYICWLTLYRNPRTLTDYAVNEFGVPNTFLKVLFTGDINKDNMPDQPVILRNESNPSNLLRVPIIRMQAVPIYDRLRKYKMQDLVFNRFRDGNKAIVKEDTDGFPRVSHPNNVGFFAGFKVKANNDSAQVGPVTISKFVEKSGFDSSGQNTNIPDGYNVIRAFLDGTTPGSQDWLTTESLTSWRSFGLHANAGPFDQWKYSWLGSEGQFANPPTTTPWNCPLDSFRNGWYGISLRTLVRKIASYAGCDPNVLATFDRTIVGGSGEFNNTNNGYDCKHRADSLDMAFVTNYNIMFGIDPRGQGVIGVTKSAEPNSNGAARVTVMFMRDANATTGDLFADQNQTGLTDGQRILIDGSEEDSYNGIWTVANVSTYINQQRRWQQDFDLQGSTYIRDLVISHNHAPNGTVSILTTSPVTYTDNDGFDSFVKDVLWQFIFKLKFPITQSGETIGMPYMAYRSRWKAGQPIPTNWAAGTKFNRQPRKIESDCVKVSQRGDSGYALCPPNGKLPPIEIPPLRWRTHQYGTKAGIFTPNIVYDSAGGKNWRNQTGISYGYYTFGDNSHLGISLYGASLTEPQGWIPGSYLYEPYIDAPGSNPRYPSVWNNWCDVNAAFPSGDWSGHYALQALVWHGATTDAEGTLGGTMNPLPNQFNAMYDIAREAALEFIANKEMYVRDFLGLLYTDDPDGEYEDSWQEGGKQVWYRMENRVFNFLTGCITSSEWQASPVDKYGQLNYGSLDNAPQVEFFNGASTGVGGAQTSGTGSGAGDTSTTTQWNDTFRVTTRQVTLYSGGVVIKTFAKVAVFETYDSTNSRWVAQYGFLPEYDPDGASTYGANSLVLFHYKGTEKGNCLITGLSGAGLPDYWFSAITQFKHGPSIGTDNSSIQYNIANIQWSEDVGKFLVQRPLEVANVNRRIYVTGRFVCNRFPPHAGFFGGFVWKDLMAVDFPMSNIECFNKIDEDLLAPVAVAPSLIGNANDIEIKWNSRYKPVSIMAQAWGYNDTFNNHDWQIGANPVQNQKSTNNSVKINFWLNDWAGIGGSRHLILATGAQLDAQAQLDYYVVDFWGTLEIIGDDSSTA